MPTSAQASKARQTMANKAVKTAAQPRATKAQPHTAAKSPARKIAKVKTAVRARPVVSKAAPSVVKAPAKPVKLAEVTKSKAAKKPKLVRDSFTMPKDEYQAIDSLKARATRLQRSAKKSELLRAGIMALSTMDDKAFAAALAQVPALKTGRPGRT